MSLRFTTRRAMFIASIAGVTLSFTAIFFLTLFLPAQISGTTPRLVHPAYAGKNVHVAAVSELPPVLPTIASRPGRPVRLQIPILQVDAPVDYVGLTAKGEIGVPKGVSSTAWYELGPRPGEAGSSIIDGHYGWLHGVPAVFDKLHKLRVNDTISVVDENNMTIFFRVREIRTFGLHDDTASIFSSNDGLAHLNLITCGGVWDQTQQSFSNRLVVFTDKVPPL